MEYKILVVDDEPDIVELLSYNLTNEGYKVQTAVDGLDCLQKAVDFEPHLIILDIMMPNLDGIETARRIKKIKELQSTVILFLTARSEEYTEITAFEVGADDFISKPIKPKALVHRVQALLKRGKMPDAKLNGHLSISDIFINPENYSITKSDGSIVVLPRKEFQLFHFLSQHPNKVFDRDMLLQKVWKKDMFVLDRTVDVHIRKVREKIGEKYIKTLKGVGYMFVDE
jgi:two-component system, OmpR family, alkaline phosphatase synthesis response regulator PhoP